MPFNVLKSFKARKNRAVDKTSESPAEEPEREHASYCSPDATFGSRAEKKSPQHGNLSSASLSSGDTKVSKSKGWASRVRSALAVCP
jgi:hypothetical protein